MRKLILIALVAMLGWSLYWFVGASAAERGFAAWLDARRSQGWVAETASLKTRGFPNRFDTTFTALELADPNSGLAWSAPFFQVFALSYKPNHIIAVWPDGQTLATPDQRIEVAADDMRGSLVFEPGTDLALQRLSLVMQGMGFSSTEGWSSYLQHAQLAARQGDGDATYDLFFEATDITPASEFMKRLDQVEGLTGVIKGLNIEASVQFSAPWDRFAVERARPQPRHVDLKLLKADWGRLDLWMAGTLEVDSAGRPTGEITVKAKNWREMVALARQAGFLPEALAPGLTDTLAFLASLNGDPDTLDAPLTFRAGRVFFGPLPLGNAPRLVIH